MLSTYTDPLVGWAAVVPQLAPPCAPGIETVSIPTAGGVNNPPLRALAILSFHDARSSGVRMYGLISFTLSDCLAKGGGLVGKGCVGHASSPGTSLFATGRSSIGQIGSPVTRLKTYRKPVFPACATTSTSCPFRRIVVSCGAAVLS